MKMNEQDLIELISRYLDNALSPEETGHLLEIVRADHSAADLLCELSIQHVQLHRLFKKAEATVTRPAFSVAPFFYRFGPSWRPLAIAAGLAVIVATGLLLGDFLRERYAAPGLTIALLKTGEHVAGSADSMAAPDGIILDVPPGTIQLLRFKDGTVIQLEPGSTAQIVDDGVEGSEKSCKIIKLTSGVLMADVAGQHPDFPLKILTPHAEITVAGTRFTCKVEHDHTRVLMHSGWAHVTHAVQGVRLKLMAGHHVTAGERFHFKPGFMRENSH